jgi:endonuclease/exonuclease/phosphatase family metal-dependent hydrolase
MLKKISISSLILLVLSIFEWVDLPFLLFVLVQSVPLILTVVAIVILILDIRHKRWLGIIIASVSAFSFFFSQLTLPSQNIESSNELKIFSLNCYESSVQISDLVSVISQHQPDVVVLHEADNILEDELQDALGDNQFQYSSNNNASGNPEYSYDDEVSNRVAAGVILSRFPMDRHQTALSEYGTLQNPAIILKLPNKRILLQGVHLYPPIELYANNWRDDLDLAFVTTQEAGSSSSTDLSFDAVIFAGDFNSQISHPGFRKLLSNLEDPYSKCGLFGTFCNSWKAGSILPSLFQLDHILVKGLGYTSPELIPLENTDHLGVFVKLFY